MSHLLRLAGTAIKRLSLFVPTICGSLDSFDFFGLAHLQRSAADGKADVKARKFKPVKAVGVLLIGGPRILGEHRNGSRPLALRQA